MSTLEQLEAAVVTLSRRVAALEKAQPAATLPMKPQIGLRILALCRYHDVNPKEVCGKSRRRTVAVIRRKIVQALRTEFSIPEIARAFDCSEKSVRWMCCQD